VTKDQPVRQLSCCTVLGLERGRKSRVFTVKVSFLCVCVSAGVLRHVFFKVELCIPYGLYVITGTLLRAKVSKSDSN